MDPTHTTPSFLPFPPHRSAFVHRATTKPSGKGSRRRCCRATTPFAELVSHTTPYSVTTFN
ncbi:hypothetical protein Hanom_Chr10g00892401 [Helianthus anomalus]